jgi:hypothetical protein
MGKFVYLYYSGQDAQAAGTMEAWTKWFGQLGDQLIDPGNPFAPDPKAVHQGGTMDVQGQPATGYSIVKADNLEAAIELAKGCPLNTAADGAVCVYEAVPM